MHKLILSWNFVFLQTRLNFLLAVFLVLYLPIYVHVTVVHMDHLCHHNLCHVSPKLPQRQQEEQHTTLAIEENWSIGILVMLFILSWGCPGCWLWQYQLWLSRARIYAIQPAVLIIVIEALQGLVLFGVRVARLSEVRQFWKRLLCCKFNSAVQAHTDLN